MKYAFVAVLFAAVASAQSSTTMASSTAAVADRKASTTAPPKAVYSPTAEEKCLAACPADGDGSCQAKCVKVPFVKSVQVDGLNKCMIDNCDPVHSIPGPNKDYPQYASCRESCIAKFYYDKTQSQGVPQVIATDAAATGGSGSDDKGAKPTGTGASGSEESAASGSGTATGSGAKSSSTGSAGNKVVLSMGGLVGALGLAVLAL